MSYIHPPYPSPFAGTGLKDAINILEPLTADPVNYVRQGALLASALVLVNTSEALNPKVCVNAD